MRHMSKSALAASLLMCQKMSWGWMIDNVNATVWVFKFDSSACLFYFYLSLPFREVFHTNRIMCKMHNFVHEMFSLVCGNNSVFMPNMGRTPKGEIKHKKQIDCSYCKSLLAAEAPQRHGITALTSSTSSERRNSIHSDNRLCKMCL